MCCEMRILMTEQFEAILQLTMQQVKKNTGVRMKKITQITRKVIEDLPREYGQLSEADRSWETFIAYLYSKYLKELGKLG